MKKKLKVAFLVDDLDVSIYIYDLIKLISDNNKFENPLVFCIYNNTNFNDHLIIRIIKKIIRGDILTLVKKAIYLSIFKIIKIIELKNLKKNKPDWGEKISIRSIKNIKIFKALGVWSKSKNILRLNENEINLIKSNNIDVILRCGSGILRGEVLSASKWGVLSFHHGDNRINRGGPSGFWEVLNCEPSSGFIIQKLTEELDGGNVLFRGNIMTASTWHENNANLIAKSYFFMERLLVQIAENNCLPPPEGPALHDRVLYKIDNSYILLKYVYKVLFPILYRKIYRYLFGVYVGRWSVAYSKQINLNKSLWRYKEIANPKGRFLADPFVFSHNDKKVIFAEDYFFKDRKGRISAVDISAENDIFLGVVLEEKFHLSFPFVFESNASIYMIPESCENKDIRLYECIEFPIKWQIKKILMSGVSAADTMVFKILEKWFMLTNICSVGLGDHKSELHIFCSNDLISSDWKPIGQGNPVIFNSENARNGGFFQHGGTLYRINQIHGKNHYGKGFGINKVETINEFEYKETRFKNVGPYFKKDIFSTHHFNALNDVSVIDYCKHVNLEKILKE